MKHPVYQSVIRDRTRRLLREFLKLKRNTFGSIARDTELSETWIAMFHNNKIKHTDIGRVERLHDYVSDIKIKDLIQ
jgi:hypothetical protein